ncbi:MAG: GGDEF and EAL domain-containing protein [Oleiphilaceae bacterium]|nr:GGDEF and EAL domain-containing protein [Oleiphilaceae bacterium]
MNDLYALRILDTRPEVRFDRFTQLTAYLFQVPICLVTFIDGHRQWVKSAYGGHALETPIPESYCAHSLDESQLMVPDTLLDPRFRDKALTTGDRGVRFYAGALLKSRSGHPIGRLCIMDQVPRRLSEGQQWCLSRLAELVNQEVLFDEHLESARQELSSAALNDPVTGLPGQLVTEEWIAQAVEKSQERGQCLVVANVHYRRHDQLLGLYGAQALNQVASLLAKRLLELASGQGFVGRTEGDRMVVACYLDSAGEAREWSRTLLETLEKPFEFDGGSRSARSSIGISMAPDQGHSASELLNQALLASSECEGHGVAFYSGERSHSLRRRDRLVERLGQALENGEIELAYQPVYRCDNGQPVTCEPLARWQDAKLGAVSPGDFIPLAEADPRLSRLLSRLVLRQACEAAVAWNRGRDIPLPVNVNIAGPEFMQPDFIDEVVAILGKSGLPGELLVLELTEQTVISDLSKVIATVRALRERGIRCALDDFGTGYSSLSYLRQIPFHALKMDRSFLLDILEDPASLEVARGIVNIGKALGMTLVAEGVETAEQQTLLGDIGCDALQGFYLARPMPLDQLQLRLAGDSVSQR